MLFKHLIEVRIQSLSLKFISSLGWVVFVFGFFLCFGGFLVFFVALRLHPSLVLLLTLVHTNMVSGVC